MREKAHQMLKPARYKLDKKRKKSVLAAVAIHKFKDYLCNATLQSVRQCWIGLTMLEMRPLSVWECRKFL